MTDTPRTIKIYNISSDTGEFIGAGDAFIPEYTGLPAHCTDMAPPETAAGFVAVFNVQVNVWSVVEDHRGTTVFDKQNGQMISVYRLGALPENTVSVAPDGNYMKWDGKKWVPDVLEQKYALVEGSKRLKTDLLINASNTITPLQDAADLDIATDEETLQLAAWKLYRVQLNRIDTSNASDIKCPEIPTSS